MQPIQISKKSWHYQLVRAFGSYRSDHSSICEYGRALIGSMLIALVCLAIVTGLVVVFGAGLWQIVVVHILGNEGAGSVLGSTGVICWIVTVCLIVFNFLCSQFNDWRERVRERRYQRQFDRDTTEPTPAKPSVIKEVYRAFRDKVCVPVEFK